MDGIKQIHIKILLPAIVISSSVLTLSLVGGRTMKFFDAHAQQNQTADGQQIKSYLNQAIQAIDTGNNTKALQQLNIAEDQLESLTGTEDEDEDEDEEEEEEREDGPGEVED